MEAPSSLRTTSHSKHSSLLDVMPTTEIHDVQREKHSSLAQLQKDIRPHEKVQGELVRLSQLGISVPPILSNSPGEWIY